MALGEAVRNIQLEEFPFDSKVQSSQTFFQMLLALEARRLHLAFIGIGPESRLFDWLGIDKVAYGGIENLGGAPLVRDKELPDEALIMFGSPYRSARVDQVTYAIKSHMFMAGEDLSKEEADG